MPRWATPGNTRVDQEAEGVRGTHGQELSYGFLRKEQTRQVCRLRRG